ncbi:unnamed protein product [Sphenostylis stenocarpa]|uniref:RING-type domain-containing protein n=1 Tax=Sphenostylis stenocarpa TaxID=92480 RepID=A0AA86SQM9_9FABA|nr:unnamed protein product [Sphenostylis stenocarpa]
MDGVRCGWDGGVGVPQGLVWVEVRPGAGEEHLLEKVIMRGLGLFKWPVLLPCNHLFGNSCLVDCITAGSECVVCNAKYGQTRNERVLEPGQVILNSSSSIKASKIPRNLPNMNKVGVGKNHKSKIAVLDRAEELEFSRGGGKPNPMQSS